MSTDTNFESLFDRVYEQLFVDARRIAEDAGFIEPVINVLGFNGANDSFYNVLYGAKLRAPKQITKQGYSKGSQAHTAETDEGTCLEWAPFVRDVLAVLVDSVEAVFADWVKLVQQGDWPATEFVPEISAVVDEWRDWFSRARKRRALSGADATCWIYLSRLLLPFPGSHARAA